MAGKILKIAVKDVNEKPDERHLVVFSIFEHTKYMNNYVIYTIEGEYHKNKLYYGSIHIKKDSIIIFSVKDNIKPYIEEFIHEYETDTLKDYRLLDLTNIIKAEIISYNEMDYQKLALLDQKSITHNISNQEDTKKEKIPILSYFLIFMLVLIAIFITILYLYPEKFETKYKELTCVNTIYDRDLKINYEDYRKVSFTKEDKVDKIDVIKTYTFLDSKSYYHFKNENEVQNHFNIEGTYKYLDNSLQLKIIYQENSIIDDYKEMYSYLKKEGFSCIQNEYVK